MGQFKFNKFRPLMTAKMLWLLFHNCKLLKYEEYQTNKLKVPCAVHLHYAIFANSILYLTYFEMSRSRSILGFIKFRIKFI